MPEQSESLKDACAGLLVLGLGAVCVIAVKGYGSDEIDVYPSHGGKPPFERMTNDQYAAMRRLKRQGGLGNSYSGLSRALDAAGKFVGACRSLRNTRGVSGFMV